MEKVIIFSGAGISAESGISTFRDAGGLWDEYKIEEICTAGCLSWNRDKTIEFYNKRRTQLAEVEPNYAHKTIAELKEKYPNEIAVITQNVDDLFERAGCQDVIHLHGYMPNIRCEQCGLVKTIGYTCQKDEVCEKCNAPMRPDIIFFHERAPMYEIFYEKMKHCEFLVVIGTSGNVIYMDNYAKKANYSILNNLESSSAIDTRKYKKVIYAKASIAIDEIAKDIENFIRNQMHAHALH